MGHPSEGKVDIESRDKNCLQILLKQPHIKNGVGINPELLRGPSLNTDCIQSVFVLSDLSEQPYIVLPFQQEEVAMEGFPMQLIQQVRLFPKLESRSPAHQMKDGAARAVE